MHRTFTIQRLGVFFRQRDNLMFPAWAFVLPGTLMRLPIGLVESLAWTVFTYFETGLTLTAGRCVPSCLGLLQHIFQVADGHAIRSHIDAGRERMCCMYLSRVDVLCPDTLLQPDCCHPALGPSICVPRRVFRLCHPSVPYK